MADKNDRTTHYALAGSDGVYYGLHAFAGYYGVERVVTGDGKPLEQVRPGWFRAPEAAGVVEVANPPKRNYEGHGYKLIPGAHKVPGLTLHERITEEAYEELPDALLELYARISVEVPQPPDVIVADKWVWLEGEPAPDDPRVDLWRPNLPAWLKYGLEYSHVFPGTLVGFRTAMKEVVEAIVDGDVYHQKNGFKVFASYTYFPPRHHEAKPYPRSRHKVRRESKNLKKIFVGCPETINGENLADALANWDRRRDELEDHVRSVAKVHVCSACNGQGYLGKGGLSITGGSP